MEVPAETFTATVETYNTYCENGEDPDFGKTAESIVEYLTGETVNDEWTDHDASMKAVAEILGVELD